MKKVLLVGSLGEIVRSLNECLSDDFFVQLCSEDLENVQSMVKIVRPALIIVCQIGVEEVDRAIFDWMQEKSSQTPVLVITTREGWEPYREFYDKEAFSIVYRPIAKWELVHKCRQILHMDTDKALKPREMEKSRQKKKIMLIDDSPLLLRSMKSMLEKYYQICLAKSGEQALRMIPEERPDLILLDYEMEGMDGKDTFEVMKEDEEMKEIPVVFLTSISDKKAVYSVLKSKPEGYILKPPDENRIFETIEEILKERDK